METFGKRLAEAMDKRGRLCVGIDPHAALLTRWGLTDDIAGLERFARTVVEALADRVAVLKPQSAFFERFGSRGIGILESTIRQSQEAGALVLLDVKRGDIGSTMAAYADAYLNPASPLCADAITVSPYLGVGSLQPAFDVAARHGGGVFVVALTSNPEGRSVQHAVATGKKTVGQTVIDEVSLLNKGFEPLGSAGLVIGATIGDTGHDLSRVNGPLLAPGLGAQGATPSDLRSVFGESLRNVLPSYSREVLAAGPSVAGLRAAADRVADECRSALG